MRKEELRHKAARLAEKHSADISSEDFVMEINHITLVHNDNFGREQLGALEQLIALAEHRLESILPYLSVSMRMFLTAPATVA